MHSLPDNRVDDQLYDSLFSHGLGGWSRWAAPPTHRRADGRSGCRAWATEGDDCRHQSTAGRFLPPRASINLVRRNAFRPSQKLRRAQAKCANAFAIPRVTPYLIPKQLGVGVPGGCEAATHAARKFLNNMGTESIMVKLDISNAFNSL